MGATSIEWTGTPLAEPLVLSRALPLGGVDLPAGTHTMLPGFTFNPWLGCQRTSEACRNCYAEAWAERAGYTKDGFRRLEIWGPPSTTPRVKTSAANWKRPHRWNRIARDLGVRFKVFCASLADVGEDHPLVKPWREELFALIDATPHLDWLLLTKRPAVLGAAWPWRSAPHNVWVGATMEDQPCAERRAEALLKIPAAEHFASVEPMVGALELEREWLPCPDCSGEGEDAGDCNRCGGWGAYEGEPCGRCEGSGDCPVCDGRRERGLSWVIIGGESGPGHRTLDLAAADALARQCVDMGVAVFVKQDSGPHPGTRGRLSAAMWTLKQFPGGAR